MLYGDTMDYLFSKLLDSYVLYVLKSFYVIIDGVSIDFSTEISFNSFFENLDFR